MSAATGYYYLHQNGDMIWKPDMPGLRADLEESDLVKKFWHLDSSKRGDAWIVCIEALALGARRERVMELAAKWGLTDDDAENFFTAMSGKVGAFRDGGSWCAHFDDFTDIQESQTGFGPTILEALGELAKQGRLLA